MGILRLILRAFRVGRSNWRPRAPRVQYNPVPDAILIEASETIKVCFPTPAQRTVTTVTGPCWVVDGDTIIIDKISIRLFGIDAPELDHPYGQQAKWALLNLCKGQLVRAVFDGSLSHDRSVAICYLPDGRDLSAEMVKCGMALDWPKYSGGKYRQFEHPGMRRILWRADARQKGRFPPTPRI